MNQINYTSGGIELIDVIEPLWLTLNKLHQASSPYFADSFNHRTFAERKKMLVNRLPENTIRIDIAHLGHIKDVVAYCISSVDSKKVGEIDSLFVLEPYRRQGIARHLMSTAHAWMDSLDVVRKIVVVSYGNDQALEFYKKLGFFPANYELQFKNNK